MRRAQALRRRLRSLESLSDTVTAMKSSAAHHYRRARQKLGGARAYRSGIDEAIAAVGIRGSQASAAPPGFLLVAADLGLCGDYNSRLAEAAIVALDAAPGARLYCIGRRTRSALARAGTAPQRIFPAPTGVAGLTRMLLEAAQDLLEEHRLGRIGSLTVIAARFDGAGKFTPVATPVLPVRPPHPEQKQLAHPYVTERHLRAVAVREYLYVTLHEILLDALASEHGMRLLAVESARQWLDERILATGRQLAADRREAITQEVLDVAAAARIAARVHTRSA